MAARGTLAAQTYPDQAIWYQFQRLGAQSPAQVSAILQEANVGRPARFVDLVHELREKDGHGHAVLQTRELGVTSVAWQVTPPKDPNDQEVEAAETLAASLRDLSTFPEALAHLTGEGVLFGHATTELDWEVRSGRLVPVRSRNLSCRRFGFRLSDSALLFDPSSGVVGVQNDGVDLLTAHPVGKFIQIRRRVTGDVLLREGLGRLFVWYATFRNWTLRDWLQLAEMAWKPARIGRYKRGASKRDIDDLVSLLEEITASGVATHSEDVTVELAWPKGTRISEHAALTARLAEELSKATLGQTLTTDAGERGARSLGEVHDQVRRDIRDADAVALGATIQRFVVAPYYGLNWGAGVRPGSFAFLTEDRADLREFAESVKTLGEAGLRIPVAYVYDQAGIPTPAEGEAILGAPAAPSEDEDEDEDEPDDDDIPVTVEE